MLTMFFESGTRNCVQNVSGLTLRYTPEASGLEAFVNAALSGPHWDGAVELRMFQYLFDNGQQTTCCSSVLNPTD
jgi:hypothetical protein